MNNSRLKNIRSGTSLLRVIKIILAIVFAVAILVLAVIIAMLLFFASASDEIANNISKSISSSIREDNELQRRELESFYNKIELPDSLRLIEEKFTPRGIGEKSDFYYQRIIYTYSVNNDYQATSELIMTSLSSENIEILKYEPGKEIKAKTNNNDPITVSFKFQPNNILEVTVES